MTFRGTPEEIAALKVGDVLYNFDGNRRTYDKPNSGPTYEKHFEPIKIVGETKVSWVMGRYEAKVNKKTLDSRLQLADGGYFTKSAMEADIWMHEHRHKIVRAVDHSASVEQLKEIARLIGYKPSS